MTPSSPLGKVYTHEYSEHPSSRRLDASGPPCLELSDYDILRSLRLKILTGPSQKTVSNACSKKEKRRDVIEAIRSVVSVLTASMSNRKASCSVILVTKQILPRGRGCWERVNSIMDSSCFGSLTSHSIIYTLLLLLHSG